MERVSKYNQQGMTMIEMVIVIAIIGIISAIAILQYNNAVSARELNRAAWELASDIRWMQQMSANDATPRKNEILHPGAGTTPDYRYKLSLISNTSSLKDKNYYSVSETVNTVTNVTVTNVMKKTSLTDYNVEIIDLQVTGKTNTSADITFYAYDPDYMVSSKLANTSYRITLKHKRNNAVLYVNVDSRVGRVRVTDNESDLPI